MRNFRKLSLEFSLAAFGYRVEFDLVPFQFAKPQISLSPGMCMEQRLPSLKAGPLHVWTMMADRWEIGFSVDFRASFHTHVFQRVYPNLFVWPDYIPNRK